MFQKCETSSHIYSPIDITERYVREYEPRFITDVICDCPPLHDVIRIYNQAMGAIDVLF